MTSNDSYPRYRRVDLQGSRVGDDIVIFDDRIGKYFASGPVGADIWEMLTDWIGSQEICANLLSAYEIDDQTCRDEVNAFLTELTNLNLVQTQTHRS